MTPPLLDSLRAHGHTTLSLPPGLDWAEVLARITPLLGRSLMGFDGTADCFGVNQVALGEGTYRSGTPVALGLHQEGYDTDPRPGIICFYCMEPGRGGRIRVARTAAALALLSVADRSALHGARVRFRRRYHPWGDFFPLVSDGCDGNREILRYAEPEECLRQVEVVGASPKTREALDGALRRVSVAYAWWPGRCLIIDNLRCLHGREEIVSGPRRLLRLAYT